MKITLSYWKNTTIFIDVSKETNYVKTTFFNIGRSSYYINFYILNDNYIYKLISKEGRIRFTPTMGTIEIFKSVHFFTRRKNDYVMMFKLNEKELRL